MRLILIGCASVALMLMSGCNLEPSGFPLSIANVQKMDSGSIEFEEQHGKIIVRVVDKFHDCHIHVLNHDGMTKERAVTILRAKQQELKDKKPEPLLLLCDIISSAQNNTSNDFRSRLMELKLEHVNFQNVSFSNVISQLNATVQNKWDRTGLPFRVEINVVAQEVLFSGCDPSYVKWAREFVGQIYSASNAVTHVNSAMTNKITFSAHDITAYDAYRLCRDLAGMPWMSLETQRLVIGLPDEPLECRSFKLPSWFMKEVGEDKIPMALKSGKEGSERCMKVIPGTNVLIVLNPVASMKDFALFMTGLQQLELGTNTEVDTQGLKSSGAVMKAKDEPNEGK